MQDFTAKRDALFASLDNASLQLEGTALDQTRSSKNAIKILNTAATMQTNANNNFGSNKGKQSEGRTLKQLCGKESIFKRPEMPITRCLKPRKTPDYQINPHKWKKYSLSDVDISDHTNTAAAFAFLKQIDEQRGTQDLPEPTLTADTKIEFKKSSKLRQKFKSLEAQEVADAEIDKPKLKGSKLVMPEYVVGQKKEKKKLGIVKKQQRAAGSLMLSHLQEDEEMQLEEG